MEATEVKTNGQVTLADRVFGMASDFAEIAQLVQAASLPTAKQQFVASLEISKTLAEMDTVIADLHARTMQKLTVVDTINHNRKLLEEIKALKIVNGEITGKNEAERAAAMTVALQSDADYQGTRQAMEAEEMAVQEIDAFLEMLRAKQAALKYRARLIAAQLEYLAE